MHHKSNAAFPPEQVEYQLPYIQVEVPIAAQRFCQFCGRPARRSIGAEKVFAKIVIDTDNIHPLFVKKTDAFVSDQTGCTFCNGGCHNPGSSCR